MQRGSYGQWCALLLVLAMEHRMVRTSIATSTRSSTDRDVTAVAVVHALKEVLELLLVDDTIPVSTPLCELHSLHRGCSNPCDLCSPQSCTVPISKVTMGAAKSLHHCM